MTSTSRRAFDSIREVRPQLRLRILEAIALHGDQGATYDELQQELDMIAPTVSARLNELKKDGSIVRRGTRPTRSGRAASVYVAA